MTDWTYGGFAEDYDMGAVHHRGQGTLAVHDIMEPMPDWFHGDVFFSDPPCSQGNLQSFSTKAGKGVLPKGEYLLFEDRLKEVILASGAKDIYLEVFASNLPEMEDWLARTFRFVHRTPSCYYHRKQNVCWIVHACSDGGNGLPLSFPGILDEEDFIRELCRVCGKKGLSIVDPCAGRGLVPFWASQWGAPFACTELNRNRLAYALARIDQRTLKPEKERKIEKEFDGCLFSD